MNNKFKDDPFKWCIPYVTYPDTAVHIYCNDCPPTRKRNCQFTLPPEVSNMTLHIENPTNHYAKIAKLNVLPISASNIIKSKPEDIIKELNKMNQKKANQINRNQNSQQTAKQCIYLPVCSCKGLCISPCKYYATHNPKSIMTQKPTNSRIAKIHAKKILHNGEPVFQIVKFENVKPYKELPTKYIAGDTYFFLNSNYGFIEGMINDESFTVSIGDMLLENEFKSLISALKEAGKQLTKINNEYKERAKKFDGSEITIEI